MSSQPFFTTEFKLLREVRRSNVDRDLQFPFRCVNLCTRNSSKDDSSIKRYRSRNSFIMARHHMSSLLSNHYEQSKVSKEISNLWKNRKSAFDSYYRYLAALDARYLENYSLRDVAPKFVPCSYLEMCASTYGRVAVKRKPSFKVLKFQIKQVKKPIKFNNEILGLRVEDIIRA